MIDDDDQAAIHEIEKRALVCDRDAIIQLVDAFRRYRQAAEELLSGRYRDGEVDAVMLLNFESELGDIIQTMVGDDD